MDRLRSLFRITSTVYRLAYEYQRERAVKRRPRTHLPVGVISVGNLVVGGTGKTPMSMWLARHFQHAGYHVAVLSRGYGRSSGQVEEVKLDKDWRTLAGRYGDEPVLMSLKLGEIPIWVGRNRLLGGEMAIEKSGAQFLILDDGFQHWPMERDLDLVLLDANNPFGNGWLLPLGPLREPVQQLERAQALIITQAHDVAKKLELQRELGRLFPGKPLFACRYRVVAARLGLDGPVVPWETLRNQPVVVFAGIAKPESFFQMVAGLGVRIVDRFGFPDHHLYLPQDLTTLFASVAAARANLLLTTEKDAVRLPMELRKNVVTLAVDLDFEEDYFRFVSFLREHVVNLYAGRGGP